MLFFYIIKKRIKLIIAITLSSITFTILYVFFIAHPVFVTTAKLLPTGEDNSLSNIQGLASQFGLSLPFQSGSNLSLSDIYPEIVKSRQLNGIVLEKKFNTISLTPELDYINEKFNLITAFEVLEHLEKPEDYLNYFLYTLGL